MFILSTNRYEGTLIAVPSEQPYYSHISKITTVPGKIIWNSCLAWFVIFYVEC